MWASIFKHTKLFAKTDIFQNLLQNRTFYDIVIDILIVLKWRIFARFLVAKQLKKLPMSVRCPDQLAISALNMQKQAGLSRATLEISSKFSSVKMSPSFNDCLDHQLLTVWGRLPSKVVFHQRSTAIIGRLHLKLFKVLSHHLNLSLKFGYGRTSGCWYILPSIF
jgi:hypothetical protein